MNPQGDKLQEFSLVFEHYVKSYEKYMKLVAASEESFLEDFLDPCKELLYPSDIMYRPHIRKTARVFNECKGRVQSELLHYLPCRQTKLRNSLKRELAQYPVYSALFAIDKLIDEIRVPNDGDDCIFDLDRKNLESCNYLLEQVTKFANFPDPQEDKSTKKLNTKELRTNTRHYTPISFTVRVIQGTKLFLKYPQMLLIFLFLNFLKIGFPLCTYPGYWGGDRGIYPLLWKASLSPKPPDTNCVVMISLLRSPNISATFRLSTSEHSDSVHIPEK